MLLKGYGEGTFYGWVFEKGDKGEQSSRFRLHVGRLINCMRDKPL